MQNHLLNLFVFFIGHIKKDEYFHVPRPYLRGGHAYSLWSHRSIAGTQKDTPPLIFKWFI